MKAIRFLHSVYREEHRTCMTTKKNLTLPQDVYLQNGFVTKLKSSFVEEDDPPKRYVHSTKFVTKQRNKRKTQHKTIHSDGNKNLGCTKTAPKFGNYFLV